MGKDSGETHSVSIRPIENGWLKEHSSHSHGGGDYSSKTTFHKQRPSMDGASAPRAKSGNALRGAVKHLSKVVALVIGLGFAHSALAQTNSVQGGSINPGPCANGETGCFIVGWSPVMLANQGIMSVGQTSTSIATAHVTMTAGALGTTLPTALLRVKAQAGNTGNVSVCWYGGVCTATNGELLSAGQDRLVRLGTFVASPPTVFCTTGTCGIEIEF